MDRDPITLSVIQSSLIAAADEMFETLKKTSMSPIIYEVLDVGTGITDRDGNLVGSGAGIPTFVGILDKAVKRIIELHGLDNVNEGDLFITNDPYYGGVTHLTMLWSQYLCFLMVIVLLGPLLSAIGLMLEVPRQVPCQQKLQKLFRKD